MSNRSKRLQHELARAEKLWGPLADCAIASFHRLYPRIICPSYLGICCPEQSLVCHAHGAFKARPSEAMRWHPSLAREGIL